MEELRVNLTLGTDRAQVIRNIEDNHDLGLPLLGMEPVKAGAVSICGGGPSLLSTLDELTGEIWGLNATHDFLVSKGIDVDVAFLWDPHVMMADMVTPREETRYYLASHCNPKLFEKLKGCDIHIFHAEIGHDIAPDIDRIGWHGPIIGGGSGAVTRAPFLAYCLGFREIHLFGGDSSFTESSHVDRAEHGRVIDVTCGERTFKCHAWMAAQAKELPKICRTIPAQIVVHGDGLLPHIAALSGVHYQQLKDML